MNMSLAHTLTEEDVLKKKNAKGRWRQNIHSHLIHTGNHKKIDSKNCPCVLVTRFITIINVNNQRRNDEQSHVEDWNNIDGDAGWWTQDNRMPVAPIAGGQQQQQQQQASPFQEHKQWW